MDERTNEQELEILVLIEALLGKNTIQRENTAIQEQLKVAEFQSDCKNLQGCQNGGNKIL